MSAREQWWREQFEAGLGGVSVKAVAPLSGGCVGEVLAVTLADSRRVVVKLDRSGASALDAEARSLTGLARLSGLPVPQVLFSNPQMLVMEYIDHGARLAAAGERHAADLLAELHGVAPTGVGAGHFGYDHSTTIGGLPQPNPWTASWTTFFAEHRLRAMAERAHGAGRLPTSSYERIRLLADRLDEWILEPEAPSLVHGDVWTGNVLASPDGARVAAFIDPAPAFAHAEVELAFITLFATFSSTFFDRYQELRPIAPGFFEVRRHIYNLYPLLVHTRLFGGGYADAVAQTLDRFLPR